MTKRPVPVLAGDRKYFDQIFPGMAASLERRGVIVIVEPEKGKQ